MKSEQDRLFERIAERSGYSEELVRFVIRDWENSLRLLLRTPEETGPLIDIRGYLKIRFRVEGVKIALRRHKFSKEKKRKLFLTLKRFDL